MTEVILAAVVLAMVVAFGWRLSVRESTVGDKAEARDYQELRAAGSHMSRGDFHSIREKNREETQRFGDGSHAPTWGKRKWNADYTLHRGVWVEDGAQVSTQ